MLAACKKSAFALLAGLLLLGIPLLTSVRANAQGVGAATVTATLSGYFECTASGTATVTGLTGTFWSYITVDGNTVWTSGVNWVPQGTMIPYDIDIIEPQTGGPLHGEHTCEFVGDVLNASPPPVGPVTDQLWDVKYTYDFP